MNSYALQGFDPLASEADNADIRLMLDASSRQIVQNILKSYTGYFDLFSEAIQNSLDATEKRSRIESNYKPKIWIEIDMKSNRVRVADNGTGMDINQFKYCLRPNVSFKANEGLRGQKGVGATFLAYGFSFIKLQTKQGSTKFSAILRQGRQWAEDLSGAIPRPTFEESVFDAQELSHENSGTVIEIMLGQHGGERPKSLAWLGVTTAKQWVDVLKIKTPLGGVYLSTPIYSTSINLSVIDQHGNNSMENLAQCSYYFPHEISEFKTQDITSISKAMDKIPGDLKTKQSKLPSAYNRLDCIYEIWDKNSLLSQNSDFKDILDIENRRELVERHSICVYLSFFRSAKLWNDINHEIIGVRANMKLIHGGLQLASDYMVQGDLSVIPLTSAIGYQNNSHCIVHFSNGNPDMGRKVFQPELKELAEKLAVKAVTIMRRYQGFLKPDVGNVNVSIGSQLYEWKKHQEAFRDSHPLSFVKDTLSISILSEPQQEQDVIALFHQLCGIGLIKGVKFFLQVQTKLMTLCFCLNMVMLRSSVILKASP